MPPGVCDAFWAREIQPYFAESMSVEHDSSSREFVLMAERTRVILRSGPSSEVPATRNHSL